MYSSQSEYTQKPAWESYLIGQKRLRERESQSASQRVFYLNRNVHGRWWVCIHLYVEAALNGAELNFKLKQQNWNAIKKLFTWKQNGKWLFESRAQMQLKSIRSSPILWKLHTTKMYPFYQLKFTNCENEIWNHQSIGIIEKTRKKRLTIYSMKQKEKKQKMFGMLPYALQQSAKYAVWIIDKLIIKKIITAGIDEICEGNAACFLPCSFGSV